MARGAVSWPQATRPPSGAETHSSTKTRVAHPCVGLAAGLETAASGLRFFYRSYDTLRNCSALSLCSRSRTSTASSRSIAAPRPDVGLTAVDASAASSASVYSPVHGGHTENYTYTLPGYVILNKICIRPLGNIFKYSGAHVSGPAGPARLSYASWLFLETLN